MARRKRSQSTQSDSAASSPSPSRPASSNPKLSPQAQKALQVATDEALETRQPVHQVVTAQQQLDPKNEALKELAALLTPRTNKYIPWQATETQTAFLLYASREAMYGGAAGGGKSVALLMAALQYVDVPGYHALLLRRTFAALAKPGALIDLAHEWLAGTDAVWNEQRKQWTFPSGATLSFGYLDTEKDKFQYQGAAFHFVGFDELTQFTKTQYTYLFSRCRRRKAVAGEMPPPSASVPLRVRSASNPGGEGHVWVYQRFFVEGGRVFIPAKLADNPHLDIEAYREMLAELPLVERLQLEGGDWGVSEKGGWFEDEWFQVIDAHQLPRHGLRRLRFWDLASTKPKKKRKEPDYTVGTLMGEFRGILYVIDVVRFREGPAETEARIIKTAELDGYEVPQHFEQEPGSHSALFLSGLARRELKGFQVHWEHVTGDKATRAKPMAAKASKNFISIVRGAWNSAWLEELRSFPNDALHDDQVDSSSGALQKLVRGRPSEVGVSVAPTPTLTMRGM